MKKKRKAIIIILICVCAAAALCAGAYLTMNSRNFQLFGKIVSHADTDKKVVALTFDDGPTGRTDEVLAVLGELDVKSTFFLTGRQMEENMELARKIASAGHQIGNHSYSHERMIFKDSGFISSEIDRTNGLIREAGFSGEIVFRAPYTKKLIILPLALQERGMTNVTFDVEPESYPEIASSAENISDYAVKNAQCGSIILLHIMNPGGEKSLDALPLIVHGLRGKGYEFVTVNELLSKAAD
jgi:peptidoglycan-N-acetylglucosamine deacetylase